MKIAEITLEDYYREQDGLFVQAFRPLSKRLTAQIQKNLREQSYPISPWLIQLGKGGLRTNRETSKQHYYPELSLYRHVMDVASFAAYLFFFAYSTGHIDDPAVMTEDRMHHYLQALLVIAFFHDADKYVGAKSDSPTLNQIQTVWDDLGGINWIVKDVWPNFSPESLHTAVSLVENRGQSQALLGMRLPYAVEKLGHIVGQADNFLSKLPQPYSFDFYREWTQSFNEHLEKWHRLYGVPLRPLRLVVFHQDPVILQIIIDTIMASEAFYPLFVVRYGEWLYMAVPSEVPNEALWKILEDQAFPADAEPRAKIIPTTGAISFFDCHGARDVWDLVTRQTASLGAALSIKTKDHPMITGYVQFWLQSARINVAMSTVMGAKKLMPVFAGELDLEAETYRRALATALVLGDSAGSTKERRHRALLQRYAENGATVEDGLRSHNIPLEELDPLTLRTLIALQSSLLMADEDYASLMEHLDAIHGPFDEHTPTQAGRNGILLSLQKDLGLKDFPQFLPFTWENEHEGTCLLCGRPTALAIRAGEMELLGIKRAAFNNRLGHRKSLWTQSEDNFICPACLYTQSQAVHLMAIQKIPTKDQPLRVVIPSRAMMHVPVGTQADAFRSFDAISFKEGKWVRVLPWNSDQHLNYPLGFEERPAKDIAETARNDDVLSQVWRMAMYCLLSGESVHVFVTAQRSIAPAFYFEPMPQWLKGLIKDFLEPTESGAIARRHLPCLIERLNVLRTITREPGGREAVMDLPTYGAATVAYVILRSTERKGNLQWNLPSTARLYYQIKEWYPMGLYQDKLDEVARKITAVQPLRSDDSHSQYLMIFRTVLDAYQFRTEQISDREFYLTALTGLVYQSLTRSESHVYLEKVRGAVAACYELIELIDQDGRLNAKMAKYLLAAVELAEREEVMRRIAEHKAKNLVEDAVSQES